MIISQSPGIRLRDNIEELRRSLEPKENALEALQQSLLEKEQVLEHLDFSIVLPFGVNLSSIILFPGFVVIFQPGSVDCLGPTL